MKIALIMPPMDSGPSSHNYFRLAHELAKAKPHWTRAVRRLGQRWRGFIDFEDFPKGLIVLGTMIGPRHQTRLFNFINAHHSVEDVLAFCPDVIGVTCSTGSSLIWVDEFTRAMKQRLGSTILLGGPHVTLDPLPSLLTTVADFVFIGEADLVVSQVIEHIDGRIGHLPAEGIGYYDHGRAVLTPAAIVDDLALLPQPNNSLVELQRYLSIGVESSRGCSRACDFCFLSGFSRRCRWRPRPIAAIVAELEALAAQVDLQQKKIYFLDLNFSQDRRRMLDLCDALVAARLDRCEKWVCTDLSLDAEVVQRLLAAGFVHIYVGVESGASTFIERYGKTGSRERVVRFFAMTKSLGLVPEADLVLLAPGETRQTIEETMQLCRQLYRLPAINAADRSLASFNVHLFKVFPNTKAAGSLAARGVRLPCTLRGWGELYERLARGDYSPLGGAVAVSKARLLWTLARFAALNLRGYVLPRLVDRLRQRARTAWRRMAGG